MTMIDLLSSERGTTLPTQDLAAGQLLFQQGEPAASLFVVARGRIRLERHTRGDRTTSLGVVQADAPINPSNLLMATYEFDAIAERPSRVIAYPLAALESVWAREESAAHRMVSDIVDRLRALETLLELRSISPARDRILHYLLAQLPQTAPSSTERSIVIDRKFKEIARDLDLSAEAFYRTLASLERNGYLTRKKGQIDLHLKAA